MHRDPIASASGAADKPAAPIVAAARADDCDQCSIVKEADHRIANHLALLASYVRMKSADLAFHDTQPAAGDTTALLEGIGLQIDALARLHRSMNGADPRFSNDIGDHLRTICTGLKTFLSGRFEFVEDISPACRVPDGATLPLTQIAAEVLMNAIKHGRPKDGPGRIFIGCRTDDTGTFVLEIADNGPGLSESFEVEALGGLGFRLLRGLSRRIGASVAFISSQDGLRFRLSLPQNGS